MPSCKLTKRVIDALPSPSGGDAIWWDEDLKGFGLEITPAGRKVFLVQYRPAGDRRNPRKYTIGEYGPTTPYQARVEAQRVLAERTAGRDPQAEKQIAKRRIASEQVEDLAAEFIARHVAQNRTAAETTRILHREVLPYWASWTVGEVRKRDVIALSGVAAVYQRHEFMPERKEALQRWGKHINSISLQSREHRLGKEEVESSILSGSTSQSLEKPITCCEPIALAASFAIGTA